jgi:hypothetical protein
MAPFYGSFYHYRHREPLPVHLDVLHTSQLAHYRCLQRLARTSKTSLPTSQLVARFTWRLLPQARRVAHISIYSLPMSQWLARTSKTSLPTSRCVALITHAFITHVAMACTHVSMTCTYLELPVTDVSSACPHVAKACTHVSMTCTYHELPVTDVSSACPHVAMVWPHVAMACTHVASSCLQGVGADPGVAGVVSGAMVSGPR